MGQWVYPDPFPVFIQLRVGSASGDLTLKLLFVYVETASRCAVEVGGGEQGWALAESQHPLHFMISLGALRILNLNLPQPSRSL